MRNSAPQRRYDGNTQLLMLLQVPSVRAGMQARGTEGIAKAVERLERSLEELSEDVGALRAKLTHLQAVVEASGTRLEAKVDELGKRLGQR